jgi:hypothetical protein
MARRIIGSRVSYLGIEKKDYPTNVARQAAVPERIGCSNLLVIRVFINSIKWLILSPIYDIDPTHTSPNILN